MKKPKPKGMQSRWLLGALIGVVFGNTAVMIPQAKAQESDSLCPPSPGSFAVPNAIRDFPNPDLTVFCPEDRVILTYGPFQVPILVRDLRVFAETGEMTKTISQIVKASKVDAETLRGLMTLEVGFDLVPFACIIYSEEGQKLTDAVGTSIRTHRRVANGKAIRAALINALSNDGKLSFLDIVESYPVPGMYIDIGNIPTTVNQVKDLAGNLGSLFRKATQYGKAGCSLQEIEFPTAPPRPPAPPPVPLPPPLPPPPPPPAPPVRGLW